MKPDTTKHTLSDTGAKGASLGRRVAWLVGIWAASIAILALVAALIKWVLA